MASGWTAPTFIGAFGSPGDQPGQFAGPYGVAAAPNGTIYVADEGNDRVQIFGPTGVLIGTFGSAGAGPGEFEDPYYAAVSADGNEVFVADYDNMRIQVFNSLGGFLREFPTSFRPNALAQDASGNLWISDYDNNLLFVYSPTGTQLNSLPLDGNLDNPEGVALFPTGGGVVADNDEHRVALFDQSGAFTGAFGTLGTGPGEMAGPTGVAIAGNGTILVADTLNNRVQYFTSAGQFLGEFGTVGDGPGQFDEPIGIAVLPNGIILVTDRQNERVCLFSDPDFVVLPTATARKKPKIQTQKSRFTLRGTATAGFGTAVDGVFVKVGKKSRRLAKGTTRWRFVTRLKPGNNRIKIFSQDELGQRSAVVNKVIRRLTP